MSAQAIPPTEGAELVVSLSPDEVLYIKSRIMQSMSVTRSNLEDKSPKVDPHYRDVWAHQMELYVNLLRKLSV